MSKEILVPKFANRQKFCTFCGSPIEYKKKVFFEYNKYSGCKEYFYIYGCVNRKFFISLHNEYRAVFKLH